MQAGKHPRHMESLKVPNIEQNKPEQISNHRRPVRSNSNLLKFEIISYYTLIKAVHLKMLESSQTS